MKADEKILSKIRKLIAKAKDPACTEAEVELFMQKAQELMMTHDVSEGSIEIHPSDINKDVIISDLWKHYKFKYRNFEWELLDIIGKAYNCKIYHGKTYLGLDRRHSDRLTIIGTNQNRIIVQEMYELLVTKFLSLVSQRYLDYIEDAKKRVIENFGGAVDFRVTRRFLDNHNLISPKNVFAGSYLSGCLDGLRQKLAAQRRETILKIDSVKHGLMVVEMDKLIELRVPELLKNVTQVDGISKKIKIDGLAYNEGVKDGKMNHENKLIQQ